MMNNIKTWLQSSQDSTQIANTVKGTILAISSIIVYLFSVWFHVTLSATDIVNLATEIGAMAGALWAVWGILMKLVVWFGTVKTNV